MVVYDMRGIYLYCHRLPAVCLPRLLQLRALSGSGQYTAMRVKNDHRCRMKHAIADRLTYLHESYQLMYRLQDAGLKADVEPWDRDSDSVIATILMQKSTRPIFCG